MQKESFALKAWLSKAQYHPLSKKKKIKFVRQHKIKNGLIEK